MAGFAWNALREAVYGPQANRLLLVRYESLTTHPMGTLAAIYDAIGEPMFAPYGWRNDMRYFHLICSPSLNAMHSGRTR
jgi:hypothetical protein